MANKNTADIQKFLKSFDKRLENIESQMIERRAEFYALQLCLLDITKTDKIKFLTSFETYKSVVHQILLERIEDFSPLFATMMDKRGGPNQTK